MKSPDFIVSFCLLNFFLSLSLCLALIQGFSEKSLYNVLAAFPVLSGTVRLKPVIA